MSRYTYILVLFLALLLLALLGWTVQGIRWAFKSTRRPVVAPANG